jgi:ATP-dependent helicase/nuclease subunit A
MAIDVQPFVPADEDARRRIENDLDSTLFVEAGAGTGKTTSLVGRILRLVASGRADMRRIAAITFTEKAAAELRDRIREEMEKAARDGETPSDERSRIEAALPQIDAAAIETLHGFAQCILSAHPLEAGLPPAITVHDEIVSSIAFEERWRDYLDELLENPSLEDVLVRANLLGLDLGELRDLALAFHKNWDRLEDAELSAQPLPLVDARPIVAALDEACSFIECCVDTTDYLYQHLERIATYCRRLSAATGDLDILRVLAERQPLVHKYGRKGSWDRVTPDDIKAPLNEAQALRQSILDAQRAAVLDALLVEVRRFVLEYAEARRREGTLEFHDLLVLARDVLRCDTSVRQAVRAQFSYLLIDEFQDTDPIQIELAVLLASNDPSAASWQEASVEEGRLFLVGDPKQSIYRFRRADMALYRRVQSGFADRTIYLTQNFRSVKPVIDWVNAVFADVIGEGAPDAQAPYVPLDWRWPSEGGPTVRVIGESVKENLPEVRRREAQEIANVIRQAKVHAWPVADSDDAGERIERPTRYADVAILLPTRTGLSALERALGEAGVPCRVESQSLLYDTQEVRDLLTVLRSIDDPTDEVALVSALRAPALGCGDDDLLRFSQAGGHWDYRVEAPTSLARDDPVVEAMAALYAFHRERWWRPLNEIVEMVIRERRLFELAFAHGRPRERWQRLRFVLDQSRAFVEAGGSTLRQFVEWAEMQADEKMRVAETVVPEADDDAVRILTVHASKGLEFPIVVLAGLNASSKARSRPVLWAPDGRPEVRIGAKDAYFQTAGFEALQALESHMDEAEKMRLLYVAATRARDHLVLSLYHKPTDKDPSFAQQLSSICERIPDLWAPIELASLPPEPVTDGDRFEFDDNPQQRVHWLEQRAERIAALARAPVLAATTIAKQAAGAEDPNLEKDQPVEEIPPWRRGRAGTALGRAVHAVLQTIDLATGDGLAGVASAQAAAEGIPDRADEIEGSVRAALGSSSVRAAVESGRFWREVYVAVPIEGVMIEGFIDLLYETPEGLVVVDYKTDRLPSEAELDAALERYRLQGAAYALALREALGRPVAGCRFVFVLPSGAIERDVMELEGAVVEVRAALSKAAGTALSGSR